MRYWAFVPLGIVLLLIFTALAEPGPLTWWQRVMAALALVVTLKVTEALFEDMSLWEEEQRERRT